MSKSGSFSRMLRIPTRKRAWSSTRRIVVFSLRPGRRPWPAPLRAGVVHRTHALSSPTGIDKPDDRSAARPGPNLELGTDQLGSLPHELQTEVAAASSGDRDDVEAASVVADLEDPIGSTSSRVVTTVIRLAPACLRMFCSASWTMRRTAVCWVGFSWSPGALRSVCDGASP